MKRLFLALVFLLIGSGAHAACNVPNPNVLAGDGVHSFVDNCPLPAVSLNRLVTTPELVNLGTQVPSVTALRASSTAAFTTGIWRTGFSALGDTPPLFFTAGVGVCSTDDAASCVNSSDGNKWIGVFPPEGLTPMWFGARGNGTTDDTMAVQAAINAAEAAGVAVNFDALHLYKITSTLNIISPVKLEGQYRYGAYTTNGAGTGISCPFGLVTPNTGITMLNVSAVTATIRGLCIDMTGNSNTSASAGAAIQFAPPSVTTYQTGFQAELNTILAPHLGITIDGFGYSGSCCGKGTSADGNALVRNTIVNPGLAAIRVGFNTAGSATAGNTLTDNSIICKSTGSQATGIGVALYDGGVAYDGTENGPEGCHIGTFINPGTVSGVGQLVSFNGDGVFGDQSGLHDLWVAPAAGGSVWPLTIGGKDPWAGATSNVNSVLIDCTASGSACFEFNIAGAIFHGGAGQNQPIFDIEGGAGGPYDVSLTGNSFCQSGAPAGGASALKLNAGAGPTGRWTIVGNKFGTGCAGGGSADNVGIALIINTGSTSNGAVTIVGNDISTPAVPLSYTPNSATDFVIIHDNMGIDNISTHTNTVTTGTTTLALPSDFSPVIGIPGTGTPTITTLTDVTAYGNRQIELVNNGTGTVTFTAGTGICNSTSVTQQNMLFGRWNVASSCYNLH